jgi:hypothetical protein
MSLAGSPWFVRAAVTMAGFLYLHDRSASLLLHQQLTNVHSDRSNRHRYFGHAFNDQHGRFKPRMAWHGSYVLESTIPPLFPLSIHENLEPGVLQRRSCYLPVEQFLGHAAIFYFSVLQRSDF